MKSIRDVYKIGKGPSSSHTMGPERAARLFLSKYPDAETYRVVLYGSLSKTGRGHGTDRVLYEVLGRERTEIVFSEETPHSLPHPNTLDFFACREGKPYATMRVASIGGGDIRIEGQDAPQEQDEVYPENSFAEIAQFCRWRYISLSEYVELNEGPGIWDFLAEVWQTMKQAVADGLAAEEKSRKHKNGLISEAIRSRHCFVGRAVPLHVRDSPARAAGVQQGFRKCVHHSVYPDSAPPDRADDGAVPASPSSVCRRLPCADE